MLEWLNDIDTWLFLSMNGAGAPWLDMPMLWFSEKKIWYPFYGLLLFLMIRKTKQKFYVPLFGIVLVIVCSDQTTSSFMKPFFQRLRPCHAPDLSNLIYEIKACGGRYGFASSHAANAFGLATFFHYLFRNTYTCLLLAWAFLVSYSRIYLAAHYPSDVLAGALVGWFFAFFIYRFIQRTTLRL